MFQPLHPARKRNRDEIFRHINKKANASHFGYKAHIGVSKDSGLVHSVKGASANIHDITIIPELLTDEDTAVYGGSGYQGAEKREDAVVTNHQGKRIRYKINRVPPRPNMLPQALKSKSGVVSERSLLYWQKRSTFFKL